MRFDAAALRQRWLSGTCAETCLRGVHSDYVMSMVLHEGRLAADGAPQEVLTADLLAEVFHITGRFTETAEGALFTPTGLT